MKTVTGFGIQYYGHESRTPGIYGHTRSLPFWMWMLDSILERHPHWDWLHRLWSFLLADYGDPFCYWYCFKWSQWVFKRTSEIASWGPVAWEDVPKKDQDWILADLRLTRWADAEDNVDPAPLVTQMREAGLL